MTRIAMMWTLLVCLAPVAAAQDDGPRFDVVSIKRNTSGAEASNLRPEQNGVRGTNVPAMRLFRVGFQVPDFQVVDVPDWFTTERFDVIGRADRQITVGALSQMIGAILVDRFGLQVTRESRPVTGYELRVERPGSTALLATDRACATARLDRPRATGGLAPCFRETTGEMVARGVSMAMLARELQAEVDRPVVDRTGLEDLYDFELQWQPDSGPGQQASSDSNLPSIFTAVREQLGLRLVPAKPLVDVYVITAAQRPSED